ncbi:glutamyl aminopeptidase-like isoform X2 [Dysidea avara]|uniref:glutamyl aminopeptidase-like isoform X2 n=1 Tax=Dysidea avara TaxID=196820 RepID=UPI003322300C
MRMSKFRANKGSYDVESSEQEDDDDLLPMHREKGCFKKLRRRFNLNRFDRREKICLFVGLVSIAVIAVVFVVIGVAVGEDQSNSEEGGGNSTPAKHIWEKVRLPSSVIPIHYRITLQPDMNSFYVNGTSEIEANVNKETDYILLHVKDITVDSFSVENYSVKKSLNYDENDYYVVQLNSRLRKGVILIRLTYHYMLTADELVGFYNSSYLLPTGNREVLATTQFEPTDARRAFPCFDEPAMKANFTITLIHNSQYHAVSNMPIAREMDIGSGLTRTEFQTSVRMSSYLVAFVVSKFVSRNSSFVSTSGENVTVRVWSRPEAYDQTEFALEVAVSVISFYEKFFDIAYPLPKQDLFAIPDFAAGAMENWGLITYRETALLYDPESTSSADKQWVGVVIAHELAHQWFGNLVTMAWWDGIWLNEGFASYVEYIGSNHSQPDWNMMDQFVVSDLRTALTLDSLNTSHPIIAEATDPDEINALFDSISYQKGATILRMLRNFMGEAFLDGIKAYLKEHRYHNAETSELWDSMDDVYCPGRSCDHNISEIMDTWTKQTGYPILTVTQSPSNLLTISQERFFSVPHKDTDYIPPSVYNYRWKIPFTYITSSSAAPMKKLITVRTDKTIQLDTSVTWMKANAGQTGLYRVNYDLRGWVQFISLLQNNHMAISAADRAGLIDDAFSIASAGKLSIEVPLNLTIYLTHEQDYLPWISALHWIYKMSDLLSLTPVYGIYEQHVHGLLTPIIRSVTWNTNGSSHLDTFLRSSILSAGWRFGDTDTINTAVSMFNSWMNGSVKSIHPDLKSVVYSAGVAFGGQKEWDYLWNVYRRTNDTAEKDLCLRALASTRIPWLLSRYLHYSFSDAVRSQDTLYVIRSVSGNIYGRSITWNFVRNNWDILKEKYGSGSFSFGRLIRTISSSFSTQLELEEFEEFFNQHSDAGSGTRSYLQAEEAIKGNIYWLEHNLQDVTNWLNV